MKRNESVVPFESLIGITVKYESFAGEPLFGKIVYAEPILNHPIDEVEDTAWLYIESNNPDENIHIFNIDGINGVQYADIRNSKDVQIDI